MARPAPVLAPPLNPAVAANRKAEYERQRQMFLERKRQEMEARKTKITATTVGSERVQRGPATEDEAAAAGLSADSVAKPQPAPASGPAKTPPKGAPPSRGAPAGKGAVAVAEPAAAEPAPAPAPAGKAALDNDFLSGLMDDPLGKSK
jgi:hypothetical protein